MANAGDAEAPLVGLTLSGKYTLEAVVGIGAMGAVYRAAHLTLNKLVAVKVLHPSLAQHPNFVERFKREAFSASRLDHPNSLRVLDFGEEAERGLVYLVLEYVEGEDLLAVMEREWPLADERVVNILSQALAALAVAHDLGIVHRDLKPENILLLPGTDDEGGAVDLVKVCDFGIAKLSLRSVEEGRPFASHLTTEGLIIGTPDYMSPEQARGLAVDGRSDLYSIGCVLYHLLAGRTPFSSESPLAIAIQHVSDPPVPPSEIRPTLPALEAVCLKALSKRPDDRYPSAREMRRALRQALGQSTSLLPSIVPAPVVIDPPSPPLPAAPAAPPVPRFSSSLVPAEVTAGRATPETPRPHPTSRRWMAVVGLGVVLIAALAVLGSSRAAPRVAEMLEMPPAAGPPAPASLPPSSQSMDGLPAPASLPSVERTPEAPAEVNVAPSAEAVGTVAPRPAAPPAAPVARAVNVDRARLTTPLPPARKPDGQNGGEAPTAKSAGENTRNGLLPLSSLPGTATSPAPADTTPAGATITLERVAPVPLERVAPVPLGPSPSPTPAMYDVSAAYVAIGAISTTAGIAVSSVRSALAHLALTSCYRQALRAQPNTSSMQATLTLSIDIAGRVVGASLSRDGSLAGLRSCVETEARGATVRDVDTGEGSAAVTLNFSAP